MLAEFWAHHYDDLRRSGKSEEEHESDLDDDEFAAELAELRAGAGEDLSLRTEA